MLWTKRAHECTIFQTFECSNKGSPNSWYNFWNHKFRVYSNSELLFSVMKDDSCIFLAHTSYTLDKNSPSKLNFWTFEWVGGLKFTKFLMPYLKSQVSFSLDFASLFNVMRDKYSVLFQLKLYMIFTTGAHRSGKFQTIGCSPNFTKFVLW